MFVKLLEDIVTLFKNYSMKNQVEMEKIHPEVIGSPIAVPWTIKDYETYVEILKKENEELKKQLKKEPSN